MTDEHNTVSTISKFNQSKVNRRVATVFLRTFIENGEGGEKTTPKLKLLHLNNFTTDFDAVWNVERNKLLQFVGWR